MGCSIGLMWSGEMLRNAATSKVRPYTRLTLAGLGLTSMTQVFHAVIHGLAHHAERVERLGRGEVWMAAWCAVKAKIHRGEQRAPALGVLVENGLGKERGGGFALGAGDATTVSSCCGKP